MIEEYLKSLSEKSSIIIYGSQYQSVEIKTKGSIINGYFCHLQNIKKWLKLSLCNEWITFYLEQFLKRFLANISTEEVI